MEFLDPPSMEQLTDVQTAQAMLKKYEQYLRRELGVKASTVKYRCPKTGGEWSGRGFKPLWLREALAAGVPLQYFAVTPSA